MQKIPRGRVATYGLLSALVRRRLTPLGVGWAMRAAPAGLPWHRVVNSKGGISTEGEHPGLQRKLLHEEGISARKDGIVDLDRYLWRPRKRTS